MVSYKQQTNMMNRLTYILTLGATVFLAGACSTDEIDVFDENNYLSFDVDEAEEGYPSLSYTFTFQDEAVKEYIYEVPVTYAGRYNNSPTQFSLQVMDEGTTAKAGTHYELLDAEDYTIDANQSTGVAKVKLFRTEEMKSESFDLILQLLPNDNFKTGAIDVVKLTITDQLVKPDYWTYSPYNRYLGNYTALKYRLFLEFMGVTDGSNPFDKSPWLQMLDYGTGNYIYKSYKDSEVKATVREFKQWLYSEKGNPTDEETQKPVSETLGSF